MEKQLGKYVVIIAIGVFLIPNLAFASWYNPVSWSFWPWNDKNYPYIEEKVIPVAKPLPAPETNTIEVVKKEPEKVEVKMPVQKPAIKTPVKAQPVRKNVQAPTPINDYSGTDQLVSDKGFPEALRKYGYRGTTYNETLSILLSSQTPEQRAQSMKMMSGNTEQDKAFRLLMEDMMNKYEASVKNQAKQDTSTQLQVHPISSLPTPTARQQTQFCNTRYSNAIAALNSSTQRNRNYLNNVLANLPSDEYYAENGTVFSSSRIENENRRTDTIDSLLELQQNYQKELSAIEDSLETCLKTIN